MRKRFMLNLLGSVFGRLLISELPLALFFFLQMFFKCLSVTVSSPLRPLLFAPGFI